MKSLKGILFVLYLLIYGCIERSPMEQIVLKNGWKLKYQNGILRDSAQVLSSGKFHGKRFQFDSLGKIESMTRYRNDSRYGLNIFYDRTKYITTKTWYKKGKRRGPSYTENRQGWIPEYQYYVDDTITFSCKIDSSNGISIEKGRMFVSSYNDMDTLQVGDVASMNVYLTPLPKVEVSYYVKERSEKEAILFESIDINQSPIIHSFLVDDVGTFTKEYYFTITDSISGKELEKFKIIEEYVVVE